jgi:hypothetical protein
MCFASDSVLATVCVKDNKQSLKLWDVATGLEVGGLDDCSLVQFPADGKTVLTRAGPVNSQVIRVYTIDKSSQK